MDDSSITVTEVTAMFLVALAIAAYFMTTNLALSSLHSAAMLPYILPKPLDFATAPQVCRTHSQGLSLLCCCGPPPPPRADASNKTLAYWSPIVATVGLVSHDESCWVTTSHDESWVSTLLHG
jgi:hypothetical protein